MVFTDVTRIAGITYLHTVPDPLFGKTEPADMIAGAVAEDFDGDGWVDLFVLRGGKAPSLLYMNQGDGTFTEESKARGADLPTKLGAAAAAADFDNDGDIDIVVANQKAPHYLLINGGTGQFAVDATMLTEPKTFATSPSWGDVNNDGMLELVLGEWNSERAQAYDASTKLETGASQVRQDPMTGGAALRLCSCTVTTDNVVWNYTSSAKYVSSICGFSPQGSPT